MQRSGNVLDSLSSPAPSTGNILPAARMGSLPRLLAAALLVIVATGRTTLAGDAPQTMEQKYKNIRALKGMPASGLNGTMNFFSASLGVSCDHCHADGAAEKNEGYELDTKQTKTTAREMIAMVRSIDKEHFEGDLVVTCATCHQGRPIPLSTPPVDQPTLRDLHAPSTNPEPLPAVAKVMEKYVEALGGQKAIEGIRSQALSATIDDSPLKQQIFRKAPDRLLVCTTSETSTTCKAYDGTGGWSKDGKGVVHDLDHDSLNEFLQTADFPGEVARPDRYSGLRMSGREKVGAADAYAIEAKKSDGQVERLYFDVKSGLLLKRAFQRDTLFGTILSETTYQDYRAVGGLQVPFVTTRTGQWISYTRRFTQIENNVAVDDSKFRKDASGAPKSN